MKVLPDTSVLIAAVIAGHNFHAKALPILECVQDGKFVVYEPRLRS